MQLTWLASAIFIVSMGYGPLMPLLPTWLKTLMPNANIAEVARQVGLLSGAYAAGVLVGAPLWGLISDRVGRRRILAIGMIGYTVSLLTLVVPEVAQARALYTLRFTTGFFVAAVVPVVSELVAEHTPAHLRGRRFAWLSAVSLLGFLFGPGLTAWLAG